MRPDEVAARVRDALRVTRADVADAKAFVMTRTGGHPRAWWNEFLRERRLGLPEHVVLVGVELETVVRSIAAYVSGTVAFSEAVIELVDSGVFRRQGGENKIHLNVGYSTIGPGGSGERGTMQFPEFEMTMPDQVTRARWNERAAVLADGDLYVREVGIPDLNPGISEALREAARCLRLDLMLPAVAMLGSASEGAWSELGSALAAIAPADPKAVKLSETIDSEFDGVAKKVSAVIGFYENRDILGALWSRSTRDRLRGVGVWSDLVRDGRNALHWGASAAVPNTYEKVATLMLAAVPNLRLLYDVRRAALDAAAARPEGGR